MQKKGFRGFPSFAIMDAEGEVIAQHNGARDASGFQESLDKAAKFIDLQKRAAAGERDAIIELALVECQMGRIKIAECEARLKDAGELNEAQKATLAGLRIDGKVNAQLEKLQGGGGQAALEAAAKEFLGMLNAGEIPSGGMARNVFVQVLAQYTQLSKNVEDLKTIRTFLKEELKDNPRAQGFLDRLSGQIADLEAKAEEPEEEDEGESEIEIETEETD